MPLSFQDRLIALFLRIFKVIAYIISIIVVLIVVAGILTRTPYVRNLLRSYLVSTLSVNLNGTIRMGRIEGNLLGGFTIDSLGVTREGRDIIFIPRVTCFYEPLSLFRKTVSVDKLVLDEPSVTLTKSEDGAWDISSLVPPSGDTAGGQFDWTIFIHGLQITRGGLTVVDSQITTPPPGSGGAVSFASSPRFIVRDIGLDASAEITGAQQDIRVRELRWRSEDPAVIMQRMSVDIFLGPGRAALENFIIQSEWSDLDLDVSLQGPDTGSILSLSSLRDDSVSLRLNARRVDYGELRKFLTHIPLDAGYATVDLIADGPYGELRVADLRVVTPGSTVRLEGTLSGLHEPENLYLDVGILPSRVTMHDLDVFIPAIPDEVIDPDMPIEVQGRFVGRPVDFTTDLVLGGEFGKLSGKTSMNLTVSPPAYSTAMQMDDFDPGVIFGADFSETMLTGRLELQGEGFGTEDLRTNFFVILDTSVFRGVAIGDLQANGTAGSGRIDAEAHAASGRSVADAVFAAAISGDTVSVLNADFSVTSLDIADLLRDSSYRSDITARGHLWFTGTSTDDLRAEASLVLLPSEYRGHPVESDSIHLTIDQETPTDRNLTLRSAMADVDIAGDYRLGTLGEVVSREFGALVRSITRHTDGVENGTAQEVTGGASADRPTDFRFSFRFNNLLPVGEFLSTIPFNVHGSIEGRLRSDRDLFTADVEGNLREFYIGTIEGGTLLRNARISMNVGNPSRSELLEHLRASLDLASETGIIAGSPFDRGRIRFSAADGRGVFSGAGRIDSVLILAFSGQTTIQPGSYVFDLDTLSIAAGEFAWINDQDVQFRLSSEGIRIMRAVFERGNERFSAGGLIGSEGGLDARFSVKDFDLSVLNVILPYSELKVPGNGFLGSAMVDVELRGTFSEPRFRVTTTSDNFILRKTRLGVLESTIDYADRALNIEIENRLTRDAPAPAFVVRGVMPANFSLTGDNERFPDEKQELHIKAENFDISIFDPLIPELQNLTGRVNGDLTIGGTPLTPVYSGQMDFLNVNFHFTPNNIPYILNGTIRADGSVLALSQFTVENLPQARPSGKLAMSGTITTDRFKLDRFDITGRGNLLIMSDETRRAIPTMYGPLFVQTDTAGVNMSGDLSRPFLRGNLLVTDAFINFPPLLRQQGTTGARRLNYIIVNDTSAGYTTEETFLRPFFETAGVASDSMIAARGGEGLTFLDQLRYDLIVETRGRPAIRFVFSQLSDEILYAELNGRVSVINEQGEPQIYGQVEIIPPSYYKFYQRFDATGKLKFVGPWDNPEMDVRAVYEASHVRAGDENSDRETSPRRVQVILDITGRRYEPILKMTLKEEAASGGNFVDLTANSTPGEVQSDAISFILTGKFSDELTSGDRSTIAGDASTGAMVGSILTSSLLTGALEDYLRKEFPFIRSVDVTYEGGSSPGTNVQVSATALRGYLRVGGKILSDVGRASVSYKASLGDILDASSIRNLFFEIEQRIETESQKKNTVEGRIYYRFSF